MGLIVHAVRIGTTAFPRSTLRAAVPVIVINRVVLVT